MDDAPSEQPEPANLRFLRILVTVLTATMIVGLVIVVGLLVTRLRTPALPAIPDQITLPGGVTATAFTRGPDWYAIVTDDDRILIYDARTGALRQEIAVTQ